MRKCMTWSGVALIAGLVMAGCSSSSATTSTTASGTPRSTGGATPQDVADAFVSAAESGDLRPFCAYAVPAQVSSCTKDLAQVSDGATYKDAAVGTVTIDGERALVVLTGQICPSAATQSTASETIQCLSNTDANLATASHQTFAQVYATAVNGSGQSGSPFIMPLNRQNGRWYASGF